ncbi:mannose-1-phosphate guanylyltransferase [Arcanobacterium haemolyticum]|uniref:mannose-1-phosphate guanylyltransferase n=1 Tax=Arcanobacterium haemolyticum TaxID=28264 RepID=UPI00111044BC|nr:mannose-1-phosphate guanylyltransferase [Arcanobacterium haemolyticum]QCX47047.1 mannose-1-phosphate guanylyltransferase [Arcanobacterium haemolyticum]
MNRIHAIIPAGGAGTRLWPVSREKSPKFLKDLTGAGKSLLQLTVERLESIAGSDVTVVTGATHMPGVVRQLPQLNESQFIAETLPRDSMAAIGLAAAVIRERHGNVVVGSFAADHLIAQPEAFTQSVSTAIESAMRGYVTTIGITPESPATGFGYIRIGDPLDDVSGACHVSEFLEKPDLETATHYVNTGKYVWNAGMFVAQTDVLLAALQRYQPELHAGIMAIARAWDTPERDVIVDEIWPGLKKIAIDHAIAEPLAAEGGVAVVPADMGWTDVGDFAAVKDVLAQQYPDESVIARGNDGKEVQPVLTQSARDCLVITHDRAVALAGVSGLIVVDTDDAVLVAAQDAAQDVKVIVDQLKRAGRQELV